MIRGINTSGRYISVSGGSPSNTYISPGSVGAGMLRYNSNSHCIEVNDGNSWQQLGMSHATIELNPEAEDLLNWVRSKKQEELRIKELCEKYPALQKAKDNYDLILNIVKDEHENKI